MARRRVEANAPAIQSWAGADDALKTIRLLDAEIAAGEAARAAELTAAQARHDALIVPRIEQRDALGKALHEFVKLNQADLGKARSRRLNHGVVGFRLGQRAVQALKGWTLAKALEALENARKRAWIAVKAAVDKSAILKSDPPADELRNFGLEIVQEERFYYDTADVEAVNPDAQAAS